MHLKIPAQEDLPAELGKLSALRAILAFAFHWGVIAGSIALAARFSHPAAFLLSTLVVATRQHALFLLVHEGAHFLISRNRAWNDWITDLFAGWPVGFSTARYRVRHWQHHRYLNSDQDPDWSRKQGNPSWTFPTTPLNFFKTNLAFLCGRGAIDMFYAWRAFGARGFTVIPYYAAIAASITYFNGWEVFALYWLVPYATVNPVLHRFRYITEHMGLPHSHILNSTRNVLCTRWERFLISPMHASIHLIHHLYPHIPWYRLPQAHAVLHKDSIFREHAYELDSYFPTKKRNVFNELTGGADRAAREEKSAA